MLRSRTIRKGLAALALLGLSASLATAQGRVDARNLSCGEARALLQQNGAIVFTTGRFTYDRYVAGERFCPVGHVADSAWIPTRDTQSCRIGYRCILNPWDDDEDDGIILRVPR